LALKVFVEVGYKKETSENIYPVFLPAAFGIGRDPFFFGYNFRTDKTGFYRFFRKSDLHCDNGRERCWNNRLFIKTDSAIPLSGR